jgi:hypothetical protein
MPESAFSYRDFYRELKASLPKSTEGQRQVWAKIIIDQDIDLKELSRLLFCEKKVATRFLWMLSGIGIIKPTKLFGVLPFLLKLSHELDPAYQTAFANYWLIAGVPAENEAQAIDLSFQWLMDPGITVTIKSRALFVLFNLTEKYPELKNELVLCLEDQLDKHSKDFRKRALKVLNELRSD